MKVKVLILLLMGVLSVSSTFATEMEVFPQKIEDEPHSYVFRVQNIHTDEAFVTPHYLGEPCTSKWSAFQAGYTRTYDQNIGFSSTTIEFAKPSVYHAVRKINRYVTKAVKKKKMSKDDAVTLMCHVLDCANAILYENDTKQLEGEMASTKDPERLIDIFNHIKLVN